MPEEIYISVTTEDGELLERFSAPVTRDRIYPLGTPMQRADILAGIESAARIVQARSLKGGDKET